MFDSHGGTRLVFQTVRDTMPANGSDYLVLACMSVDEWMAFFREVGYTGDYYWFIP